MIRVSNLSELISLSLAIPAHSAAAQSSTGAWPADTTSRVGMGTTESSACLSEEQQPLVCRRPPSSRMRFTAPICVLATITYHFQAEGRTAHPSISVSVRRGRHVQNRSRRTQARRV